MKYIRRLVLGQVELGEVQLSIIEDGQTSQLQCRHQQNNKVSCRGFPTFSGLIHFITIPSIVTFSDSDVLH